MEALELKIAVAKIKIHWMGSTTESGHRGKNQRTER